ASLDDLLNFYKLLPSRSKQFSIMEGISHASFQQKNYLMVYQILHSFFSQPEPTFRG
ncbi:MAG: alpha/beta hydrolase, partial [Betaproteobacteria bacterium]|nr:alpha/beta hydrolase [Betaproteobacteria bacterium]